MESKTTHIKRGGVKPNLEALEFECAIRNLTLTDCARRAGISPSTITWAMHGGRWTTKTFMAVINVLVGRPVNPLAAELARADRVGAGVASARSQRKGSNESAATDSPSAAASPTYAEAPDDETSIAVPASP